MFKEYIGWRGVIAFAAIACVLLFIHVNNHALQMFALSEVWRAEFFETAGARIGDVMTLTLSILVEALPFVVLGVLISVLIQVYLPTEKLLHKLPKNPFLRRLIISCFGFLLPVCECGNVPVARGLIAKGLSAEEAIIFLLTAPSVNIITFIVTWEAFAQNQSMAIVRVVATIIIANITALLVAKIVAKNKILTPEFTAYCKAEPTRKQSLPRATNLFRNEMWLITRLLVIGALIAALFQVFVPTEVVAAISGNIALSVLAMLALAFIISICSSVDAFFALAYAGTFGMGSLLAFLVAGPMVDIKMIALMKSTFTARTIAVITGSVLVLTFIVGVIFSYVW